MYDRLFRRGYALLALLSVTLVSCTDDPPVTTDDDVTVPSVYAFTSRFDSAKSSVDYGGQVVRNLLIQDISTRARGLATAGATPVTADELLALYDYSDASNLQTSVPTGTIPALERSYSSISTGKNLSGKISGATLIGTGMTADQAVRAWIDSLARISSDPTRISTPMGNTTDAGVNLQEMLDKVLNGAVGYYQATGVYLMNVLDKNNADRANGTAFHTEMEHNWDEAFGYFGAARNYDDFSDAQLSGAVDGYVMDVDGDGKIDYTSEFNFSIARYAAKRDVGATTAIDFSGDLFKAFRTGRALISGLSTREKIQEQRDIIARTWEKFVAASAIHYLNGTLENLATLSDESVPSNTPSYNKEWSELKGFLYILQFNPLGAISTSELTELHTLVGDAPLYAEVGTEPNTSYRTDLMTARTKLQTIFSFTTEDVENW